jgi:Protein of unknown function (DUF2778)
MTDTTAAFDDVTSFDGRVFRRGACRRITRFVVDGVLFGLGTLASACALVTTVTVAAAWILNTAFATHPHLDAKALIGPAGIALVGPDLVLASAADITGSIGVSTDPDPGNPADALTFGARWSGAMAADSTAMNAVRIESQRPIEPAAPVASPRPVSRPAPQVAAAIPEKRVLPQQAQIKPVPLPDPDSHTAVYDIAAHIVYLPDGEKLEAHSGLGDKLDDPRYVSAKDRGPTPPNVYDLALREQLFHEVRAIRLIPVGGDNMFGRDGILAHSYMLGANGQSNGCVSFRDYPAFLHAYLRGEVDRLVVVPHLGNTSWRTASARRGPAGRYPDDNP